MERQTGIQKHTQRPNECQSQNENARRNKKRIDRQCLYVVNILAVIWYPIKLNESNDYSNADEDDDGNGIDIVDGGDVDNIRAVGGSGNML